MAHLSNQNEIGTIASNFDKSLENLQESVANAFNHLQVRKRRAEVDQASSVLIPVSTKNNVTGEDLTVKVKGNTAEYWHAKYNETRRDLTKMTAEATRLFNEVDIIEEQLDDLITSPALSEEPASATGGNSCAKIREIGANLASLRSYKVRTGQWFSEHRQQQAVYEAESKEATNGDSTSAEETALLRERIASRTKTAHQSASDLKKALLDVAEARRIANDLERDTIATKTRNTGLVKERSILEDTVTVLKKEAHTLNNELRKLADSKSDALSHLVKVATEGVVESRKAEEAERCLKTAKKQVALLQKEKTEAENAKRETVTLLEDEKRKLQVAMGRVALLEKNKTEIEALRLSLSQRVNLLESEKKVAEHAKREAATLLENAQKGAQAAMKQVAVLEKEKTELENAKCEAVTLHENRKKAAQAADKMVALLEQENSEAVERVALLENEKKEAQEAMERIALLEKDKTENEAVKRTLTYRINILEEQKTEAEHAKCEADSQVSLLDNERIEAEIARIEAAKQFTLLEITKNDAIKLLASMKAQRDANKREARAYYQESRKATNKSIGDLRAKKDVERQLTWAMAKLGELRTKIKNDEADKDNDWECV